MIGTTYGRPNVIESDPNDKGPIPLHQAVEELQHPLAYPVDSGMINSMNRMYFITNQAYRLLYAPNRTLSESSLDSQRISTILLLDGQNEEWLVALPSSLEIPRARKNSIPTSDNVGHEKALLQMM